ncbi:hypothetical protein BX600DRAFT_462930 [Xylariales sp. PMI_506]|nr:hypothetical protein BX600DRAFT_462930 [Xylariales sp. PMI_506]
MPHFGHLNNLAKKLKMDGDGEETSMRARVGAFLTEELHKGKHKLEKSLGLGQTPSVIPDGEINISGSPRMVEIGWHPVAGLAGKWFAEKTGLGKMITDGVNHFPDPTQHWAVLVGDYCHQLWMDEKLDVIYTNGKIVREEWHTYEVGKTRFNDEALKQAGDMTIFTMREKKPGYNLIDNNCQIFALKLLDSIRIGKHREFATSLEVYKKALSLGNLSELFVADHPDDNPEQRPDTPTEGTMPLAEQIMDVETNKMSSHATAEEYPGEH